MVFSVLESFQVNLSGTDLQARWFNPVIPVRILEHPFAVSAGWHSVHAACPAIRQ